ncbi:hypothetical protein LINPERPRIM_LOCUS27405 [Linum perenne]|jgi:hypothetical protein
MSAQII